jgi:N-acetylneuraminic acid mutarotase
MKMMRCIAGAICVGTLFALPSCNKSPATVVLGNWVRVGTPPFFGPPRTGAYCFTINNSIANSSIAYVGLGRGPEELIADTYHKDSYAFDVSKGFWTTLAPFPGELREKAVSFSAGGKGYVGTGYNKDSTLHYLKDFWEYDPATDQWKQLKDFPGPARANAVGFSDPQSRYGYIGTGFNGLYYNDFYRYDPVDDSWIEIPFPGAKRQQATTMTIDGKVYLCSGSNNGSFVIDLWQFDPTVDPGSAWTSLAPLTTDAQYANFKVAVNRFDAVGFSMNSKGYLATGQTPQYNTTVYQYDPVGLTWTKMTSYEGAPRSQAVAFVLNGRAYLGTGGQGSLRFDDMEEFQPLADYNAND